MRLFIFFMILGFSIYFEPDFPLKGKTAFIQIANANPLNHPLFYPQFSAPVTRLRQGTPIIPLCSQNPSHPSCFNQWSSQAVPLSVNNRFQYFLPSFYPSSRVSQSSRMKGWRKSSLPYRNNRIETRSFYFNEKEPERVRMVENNREGETEKIIEGTVVFINLNDIDTNQNTTTSSNPSSSEDTNQNTTASSNPSSSEDTNQNTTTSSEEPNQNTTASSNPSSSEDTNQNTTAPSNPSSSEEPERQGESFIDVDQASSNDSIPQQESSGYRVARDTIALPATGGTEVKPGCFRLNKMETQTEADFCFECLNDIPENEYFNNLLEDRSFLSRLQDYLREVSSRSQAKVNAQISGNLSGDGADQICSPSVQLNAIIRNFETTCSPYRQRGTGFKTFFGEALCKSCEKGVPIELMMGMMSIESAGRCPARNTSGENSAGLFQVDSNQHSCKAGYRIGTERNAMCLADIHNNWEKSIEILSDFYNRSNPESITTPCKNWIDMESTERDAFRRAVAGYNGGFWFLNSIRVAKNNHLGDNSRYGTSFYKDDRSSWEEIRAFYFVQHINRNSNFGRRSLNNNFSNLAHTEAILGREVENSIPGIIEIWSQYKRDFLRENPQQCN